MPKWLSSKAQFFIISMVVIVSVLIGIQNLFAGYYAVDLSEPYKKQEDFWFRNIKEQTTRRIGQGECPELSADFVEIKMSTEKYLAKKGVEFSIVNKTPICPKGGTITIKMNMTSSNTQLSEEFDIST